MFFRERFSIFVFIFKKKRENNFVEKKKNITRKIIERKMIHNKNKNKTKHTSCVTTQYKRYCCIIFLRNN